MKVVALYNMKGGVGKTTTAVNLSYLSAGCGLRTLLWDLDPQAASSYAYRVRPGVVGFDRKSLESAETLAASIKATDFSNLDLLPADFAYRKLDRLLAGVGKPKRVVADLLNGLGRDYDVIVLDCPAGFSLSTEGLFATADVMLVPTIPTVLSLRTLAQLIKWADRSESRTRFAPFFSMVDRRKTLHRRVSDWSTGEVELFMRQQIPYASVVEQMAIRRMPLAVFAPRDPATLAFAGIWRELQPLLEQRKEATAGPQHPWSLDLRAIESLIARLEPTEEREQTLTRVAPAPAEAVDFVHTFDTAGRDLQRCGYALQLRERGGTFVVVAARASLGGDGFAESAEIRIDASWATQILSGAKSPMTVLERRLRPEQQWLHQDIRSTIGAAGLCRLDSSIRQPVVATDAGYSKSHDSTDEVIPDDVSAVHH